MVIAVIQCRLGSSRLPRKSLALINGRELVLHVVDRVAETKGLDALVVAIPRHDDDLRAVLDREGVPVVLGPEYDVLRRFALAVTQSGAETVLRVTADCPLWSPIEGARVLQLYRDSGCDYAWNVAPGYVDGEDAEVFSAAFLLRADAEALEPTDREHVGPWLRRHGTVATLPAPAGRPACLKTSVDTAEDLARVRNLMEGARAIAV